MKCKNFMIVVATLSISVAANGSQENKKIKHEKKETFTRDSISKI